jgi:hypothetical protein
MVTLMRRVLEQVAGVLRDLGSRPASLFLALFALDALATPYAGMLHDARLYAGQVLHYLDPELYANDLFFRFGSQDRYSVFSSLAAPVVLVFGLRSAFFLLYLSSRALLLWAMQRLIGVLLPDRLLSTVTLIAIVVSPLPYGGLDVFHVNEHYLTPRPAATALVLFGLERLLAGRPAAALGLVVLACFTHPLMAAPGLGLVLLWWAWERLPARRFWVLSSLMALAGTTIIAVPILGTAVFGQMDPDWLAAVRQASPYACPLDWRAGDQAAVLPPLLILLGAARLARRQSPRLARLALLVAVLAAAGLASAAAANLAGYRLLLQVQAYRALWLAAFLEVPLGLWLAAQLWRKPGPGRLLAVFVVGWLAMTRTEIELALFAWPAPVAVVAFRGFRRSPRQAGWLWLSAAASLGCAVLIGAALRLEMTISWRSTLLAGESGLDIYRLVLSCLGPALWLVLAVALVFACRHLPAAAYRGLALGVALGGSGALFLLSETAYYNQHCRNGQQDLCLVATYLEASPAPRGRPPVVYWGNGDLEAIWDSLRAESFFHIQQVQGLLFSRDTAREAARRARLACPFEMEHLRMGRGLFPEERFQALQAFLHAGPEPAPPSRADLCRLSQDTSVDVAVLSRDIDGLYAVTNGQVYLYDLRDLRARLAQGPARSRQRGLRGPGQHSLRPGQPSMGGQAPTSMR